MCLCHSVAPGYVRPRNSDHSTDLSSKTKSSLPCFGVAGCCCSCPSGEVGGVRLSVLAYTLVLRGVSSGRGQVMIDFYRWNLQKSRETRCALFAVVDALSATQAVSAVEWAVHRRHDPAAPSLRRSSSRHVQLNVGGSDKVERYLTAKQRDNPNGVLSCLPRRAEPTLKSMEASGLNHDF